MIEWPTQLQINAWAGTELGNVSPVAEGLAARFLATNKPTHSSLLAPKVTDPKNWRDPAVGWGLVLPDDGRPPEPGKAGLWQSDPEPLGQLVSARENAPVFRWNRSAPTGTLRRYYDDGSYQDISWSALHYGVGLGQIPRYLLICASPADIPWRIQYALQFACFTGRLDLVGEALENHVQALVSSWAASKVDPLAQLLWAAVHNAADITWLLRATITAPLTDALSRDGDYNATLLTDAEALTTQLIARLADKKPALIITSSHGATNPLDDVTAMRAQLGLLVDHAHDLLDTKTLLSAWEPDGAIWYAHACCSAGADGVSSFLDYLAPESQVARILTGVSQCGAITAPLPKALLGAKRPLRAFVGQVEPTFDWTLRNPETRQFMTMPLIETFYSRLFTGEPIGMALDACRRASAALTGSYQHTLEELAGGASMKGTLLRLQLTAKDWDSLVLLGDPAVTVARPND